MINIEENIKIKKGSAENCFHTVFIFLRHTTSLCYILVYCNMIANMVKVTSSN